MKLQKNLKTIRNFELTSLTDLYNNSDVISTDKNIRDLKSCKEYILKRIYPLENSKLTCIYTIMINY